MKQSVLARGICSVSYLSKIENNLTTPSEEVLEMIFQRLDIEVPLYYDLSEQVGKVSTEIREILKEAVLTRKDHGKQVEVEKYLKNQKSVEKKKEAKVSSKSNTAINETLIALIKTTSIKQ